MSENRKKFAVTGVVLFVALGGWWGCTFALVHGNDDEDRPPIVVNESSIEFAHGHRWKAQGNNKKWKPDHKRGKDVTGFDVIAIKKTSGTAGTACFATGPGVSIDYTLADKTVRQFKLGRQLHGDEHEPILQSDVELNNINRRRLKFADEGGGITKVEAGSTTCSFDVGDDVQIIVMIK